MIPYPRIPTVELGKALGAVVLNAYHEGCRYGLAQSHEPETCQRVLVQTQSYYTDYHLVGSFFLPYRGDRLSYHYRLWAVSGDAEMELRYVGDDAAEHTVLADSTASDKYVAGTKSAGVGYGPSMTAGNVYEWRLYLKHSIGVGYANIEFWELNHYHQNVTGWVAPPTFVASATSSENDFNTFQNDLNRLWSYRMNLPKGLANYPTILHTAGSTSWLTCAQFCYRYRGDRLRLNVWCQSVGGAAYAWEWRVQAKAWGGADAVIHTSPAPLTQTGDSGRWGTEAGIDTTGLGFSRGDWVLITFQVKGTSVTDLKAMRYVCQRYSTGTPAAGWQALTDWVEGDADIGPTNLNKISTDLTLLYSGAEALWGYISSSAGGGIGWWDASQGKHMGTHTRRWLHYKTLSGQTPKLIYGPNFTRADTLTSGSGWQVYDLASLTLPPGGMYELEGCTAAFEHSSAGL